MGSEDHVSKSPSPSPAVFDTAAAGCLIKELRGTYIAGKTKSYEWRESQLKGLLNMVESNEKQICDALFSDMSKPEMEAFIHEVNFFIFLFIYV